MASTTASDDWNLPWRGACRCGEVAIEVTKAPLLASACHCTGCQSMSASAFSLSLAVPVDGFSTSGLEPVVGGLHGEEQHHFCPWCKSWLFTRLPGMDEFVNVRASVLEDHAWFVPYVEFWTSEKLPWASTSAQVSFEKVPADDRFATLVESFAKKGARPAPR